MKTIAKFIIGLVLCSLNFSCKKKVALIETSQEESVLEVEPLPRKDSINGVFNTTKEYRIENGQLNFTQMYHLASFSKELISTESYYSPNPVDVGDVYLNDDKFKKVNSNGTTYGLGTYFKSTLTWRVEGNTNFKPFTYQLDFTHPVFEGQRYLPDSLYNNSTMAIYFVGTDADSAIIELTGSTMIIKKLGKDDSIILSNADIMQLTEMGSIPVQLRIILDKTVFKAFGSKFYKFNAKTIINKEIYLKKSP